MPNNLNNTLYTVCTSLIGIPRRVWWGNPSVGEVSIFSGQELLTARCI